MEYEYDLNLFEDHPWMEPYYDEGPYPAIQLPHCELLYTFVVVDNEDVMFKIKTTTPNMTSCTIVSPDEEIWKFTENTFMNQNSSMSEKILFWGNYASGDCGVQITNITSQEAGDWSLLVTQQDGKDICQYSSVSFTYASIINMNKTVRPGDKISWNSMKEDILYCDILKPNGEPYNEVFTGNCEVEIAEASFGDSGEWKIAIGHKYKTNELQQTVYVEVEEIRLDVGTALANTSTGAINLYCNLISSFYNLTTCRFTRPGDLVSFRMTPGIGDGNYLYYGNGINENECGLTILQLRDVDYGSWMCTVIFIFDNGESDILTSFVNVEKEDTINRKYELQTSENETEILNLLLNSNSSVSCKLNASLRACSVVSPEGKSFSGEKNYFKSGLCKSPIMQITEHCNGTWKCIMTYDAANKDLIKSVNVNVKSAPFSAVTPEISVNLGQRTFILCKTLATKYSLSYCIFKHPNGSLISAKTNSNAGYEYHGKGIQYGDCGLEIEHITPADEGVWICMGELKTNGSKVEDRISIWISDNTTRIFPSRLETKEGSAVILQLVDKLPLLKSCNLITEDNNIWSLQPTELVTVSGNVQATYWGTGFEAGDCGVKLSSLLQTQYYQLWRLMAVDQNNNTVTGDAFVFVSADPSKKLASKEIESEVQIVKVDLGSEATFNCGEKLENKDYCLFTSPLNDYSNPLSNCSLVLFPIRKEHIGNWTCLIGVSGSTNELKEVITVTNLDPALSISIEGEAVPGGTVTAICNVPYNLTYCRFLPPSGSPALVLSSGIVTGNYSYSGSGLKSGDCGLHISSLSSSDFGSWKCFLGWTEDEIMYNASSIITIDKISDDTELMNEESIIITESSEMKVKCSAHVRLDYCWFRHPNGSEIVPEQLLNSLSIGECSITLSAATQLDSGIWECHFGEEDSSGSEKVLSVPVTVSATGLFPHQTKQEVSEASTAVLKCQSVPIGTSLEYCRFVRPDGANIPAIPYVESDHYIYFGGNDNINKGICGLEIKGVKDEDIGEWVCAALLQGDKTETKVSLYIEKTESLAAAISGITVGSLLSIIFVGIGIVMVIRKNHKPQVQESMMMSRLSGPISQSDSTSTNSESSR